MEKGLKQKEGIFLKDKMEKEDKILLAMVQDKIDQSQKTCMPTNTGFLDLRQRDMVASYCKKIKGLQVEFHGGYEEAERRVCILFPDQKMAWEPLAALKIIKAKDKILTHRDYMGSILGLGIKRELVGDIIVGLDGAEIIIGKDLADFFVNNYEKVGSAPVKVQVVDTKDIKTTVENVEEIRQSVSSLRLDNMVAAAFNMARGKAVEAINKGLVFVNGQQVSKPDKLLNKGEKLVLRGKGKVVLQDILGSTKKDKIIVLIKKYR